MRGIQTLKYLEKHNVWKQIYLQVKGFHSRLLHAQHTKPSLLTDICLGECTMLTPFHFNSVINEFTDSQRYLTFSSQLGKTH